MLDVVRLTGNSVPRFRTKYISTPAADQICDDEKKVPENGLPERDARLGFIVDNHYLHQVLSHGLSVESVADHAVKPVK